MAFVVCILGFYVTQNHASAQNDILEDVADRQNAYHDPLDPLELLATSLATPWFRKQALPVRVLMRGDELLKLLGCLEVVDRDEPYDGKAA